MARRRKSRVSRRMRNWGVAIRAALIGGVIGASGLLIVIVYLYAMFDQVIISLLSAALIMAIVSASRPVMRLAGAISPPAPTERRRPPAPRSPGPRQPAPSAAQFQTIGAAPWRKPEPALEPKPASGPNPHLADVRSALVNLGLAKTADQLIAKAVAACGPDADFDTLLKAALKK